MYYEMSIDELKKCRYPNLMAEFVESHYSICTVADHMGYGERQEDDVFIWNKLLGKEELYADEVVALMRLFNVNANYLFSEELSMIGGSTFAFVRHYEENRRNELDSEIFNFCIDLRHKLKNKPYLMGIIKYLLRLPEDDTGKVIQLLEESKIA